MTEEETARITDVEATEEQEELGKMKGGGFEPSMTYVTSPSS